jgi:hypothetical protein
MGYTTNFNGRFELDRPLTAEHSAFLQNFASTDHRDESDVPGYYCQWVPAVDGTAIVWDETEKFYDYVEWLQYLIDNHLGPWGYTLNGAMEWAGGDPDDQGVIHVKDNGVQAIPNLIIRTEPTFIKPEPKWNK